MKTKEKYQKLSKKYKLPSFDKLDHEFEISKIDEDRFLLREIRRKIAEKIETYVSFLEDIIQPSASSLSSLYESKMYDEKEIKDLFGIYKRLMFFSRYSIEIALQEDTKKNCKYIKDIFKEWTDIKKKFLISIKKSKNNWLKEENIKEKLNYLG